MDRDEKNAALALVEQSEETADERTVYLDHGRTLAVISSGSGSNSSSGETIEIRSSSGQVELRIRMTEDGPVLQLDGVKLEISAQESVAVRCQDFTVEAKNAVNITSQAGVRVQSEAEVQIESTADVRVKGEKIWLN